MVVSTRARQMIVAGAIALTLIAGSSLRVVGDGGEYLVQALNFAVLDGPSIGRRAVPVLTRQVAEIAPELDHWDMRAASDVGADGRRDFLHFWFYALLTAPVLRVALAIGAPVLAAFTVTNLVLAGLALWVALPRLGVAACVLLFAGPIVWWIDKPHTEVFSFSLLLIAVLLARDKPWWALVAGGAAATQNLPMAIVFVFVAGLTALSRPALLVDRRVLAGGTIGFLLVCLHPAYTYFRHGTASLLLRATTPGVPAPAEIAAVIVDPTLGLVGNYPLFLVVGLVALVWLALRDWRALVAPDMVMVWTLGAVFLYSFARTANFHHGATPSLSRYGLWLVPLLAPVLVAMTERGGTGWRRFLAGAATVSAVVSVFAFHPGVPQNSREPTWAAIWLWTHHPAWQNPLPEVFSETLMHQEALTVPVATPGCEKLLLVGPIEGMEMRWPLPCYPTAVAEACAAPGTLCYANRRGSGYDFVPAPGRQHAGVVPNPDAWTAKMAADVRTLSDAWGWGGAAPTPVELSLLRQAEHVSVMALGTSEQFMLILRGFGPAPVLRFRFSHPMTGRVIDPDTGQVLRSLAAAGNPDELWSVDLPSDHQTLLLVMTTVPATNP